MIRRIFFKLFGRSRHGWRAQGIVEFALALPILVLLVFGVIEFARLFQAWLSVQNGARFGLRYAVTGEYNLAYCGLADAALGYGSADAADGQIDCRVPASYGGNFEDMTNELIDWARVPSTRDVANQGAVAIQKDSSAAIGQPRFFKVTICSSRDDNHDNSPDFVFTPSDQGNFIPASCSPRDDAGAPGDRVTVVVDFNHPLILPFISNIFPQAHLISRRDGVVERFRTTRVINLPLDISLPTYTPTITPTPPPPTATDTPPPPTATPTPDCSLISLSGSRVSGGSFEFQVWNRNNTSARLIHSTLFWPVSWGMVFDYKQFNSIKYYDVDSTSSPVDVSLTTQEWMNGNTSPIWRSHFMNWPASITSGNFRGDLTFEFPGWGTCLVSASLQITATQTATPTMPTSTPTITVTPMPPTITRTPTRTPTITPTPTATQLLSPTPTTPPVPTTPVPSPTQTSTPTATSIPSPTITFNLDG